MIEIFNECGEPRDYLTVAERISAFLESFGPKHGYSIETRAKDYLRAHPDLADLYRTAIKAGMKLTDLPPIDMSLYRFEAQLLDPEGRILAEASALRRVNTDLDAALQARIWEAGETAALQRLLARLGYGSDTLLADELGDIDERGVAYAHKGEGPAANPEESDIPDGEASEPTSKPEPRVRPEPASKAEGEEQAEGMPEVPPKPETRKTELDKGTEVSEALLRQIRHLASVRGIDPPEIATKAEAKEALKSLRATPAAQ